MDGFKLLEQVGLELELPVISEASKGGRGGRVRLPGTARRLVRGPPRACAQGGGGLEDRGTQGGSPQPHPPAPGEERRRDRDPA